MVQSERNQKRFDRSGSGSFFHVHGQDCHSAAPPLPLVDFSIGIERGRQQNDSLVRGYCVPSARSARRPRPACRPFASAALSFGQFLWQCKGTGQQRSLRNVRTGPSAPHANVFVRLQLCGWLSWPLLGRQQQTPIDYYRICGRLLGCCPTCCSAPPPLKPAASLRSSQSPGRCRRPAG